MSEQWRQVPGFEGLYDVSDHGRVRGWSTHRGNKPGHLIATRPDDRGYVPITLYVDGTRFYRTVHALVALAFHGPRPPGAQVRHLDGNPSNNLASNLAYGTPRQNQLDKQVHGTDHHVNVTACPSGHPYDEANTYVTKTGSRLCRACNRARQRARRSA